MRGKLTMKKTENTSSALGRLTTTEVVFISTYPVELKLGEMSITEGGLKARPQVLVKRSYQRQKKEEKMEGKTKKEGTVERWVKKHLLLYTGATRHPFILSIRDGSVDLSSFKRWLEQDYIFVREFAAFVASVLIKASKNSEDDNDMEVVLGGLASLNDEIAWFKSEASKWGVALSNTVVHKANQNYCRFLERLMLSEVDHAVALTAFWAIETVYQESFAHCLEDGCKTPPELQETCRRWGNEGFGKYCCSLQKIANRCLEKASDDVLAKAEVTFLRVLEHEVEFWNMSHGST